MKDVILSSWKEFKEVCIAKKKLLVQFTEEDSTYKIFAIDGPVVWSVTVMVGTPEGEEFKKKYMKDSNKPLKDL